NLNFSRMLDIGCGDGSVSMGLLKPGRHLMLQDLSDAMLARARSLVPAGLEPNVDTLAGDFLQAGLPQRTFDLVICLGVLSYVERLDAFLEKVASLLTPGGSLIIECTDGTHLVSRLLAAYSTMTKLVRRREVSISLQAHACDTVDKALRKLGLAPVGAYR